MTDLFEQLHREGYAIVRGFFAAPDMQEIAAAADRVYQEGLRHHATYRHKNLLLEVLDDPQAGRRVVLQAHWSAWIEPVLERLRRDPRYLALLEPFLGRDIKQITHQIHWKPPGAKYTFYRYHQDARFRNAAAVRSRALPARLDGARPSAARGRRAQCRARAGLAAAQLQVSSR